MTALIDDEFGLDTEHYPKKRRGKPARAKDLGPLHKLLTRGLPDFIDENGVLDVRKLAIPVGISFQALYKWFENNQVSAKRLETILHLSANTKKVPAPASNGGVEWVPLVRDDFWEFLSR